MKILWKNIDKFPLLIISAGLILFSPGFITYFHQDDFIHFSYSQNFLEVVSAFNIFQKGEFPFFRPLPTQVYFYFGKLIFGFNPFGYHLINFIVFSLNIILVYKLINLLSGRKEVAAIGTSLFGINSTHFAPLYGPAYVHELVYVLFGILTVSFFYCWLIKSLTKDYILSVIFFIFALLSKETAVILPGILLLIYVTYGKNKSVKNFFSNFILFIFIVTTYLFGHFFYYGIAKGPTYTVILGKQTLNILTWYFLWALSAPNILIDFIGPGLKINPTFFQVSQIPGWLFLIGFPILLVLLIFCIISAILKNRILADKENQLITLGFLWFIIGLIPLIIFPLHKLATEQAFSLVGLSLSLGIVLHRCLKEHSFIRSISLASIVIYFLLAVNSILLARKTHWIVRSSRIAQNVIAYIKTNYPRLSESQTIYFKNGEVKIPQWGSSKQVYYSLGNGRALNMILNKPNLLTYYEDINPLDPKSKISKNIIVIDSSKLLGY